MSTDPLSELTRAFVDIDEPGVRGSLVLGQPHGLWTHVHDEEVRVTLWDHGVLVAVLTPPMSPDPRSTEDSQKPHAFRG